MSITDDSGDLLDNVDSVLDDLLAGHNVNRYPGGAVVGWFSSGGLTGAEIRDPTDVATYPFGSD